MTTTDARFDGSGAIPDGSTGTNDPLRVIKALQIMDPDRMVEPGVRAGDALEVMTTPPTPEGVRYVPDEVYGTAGADGRELTMHLYAAEPGARQPGVVFIHGGAFVEGFPEMCIRYANHLAAEGYVTASIRYRLATEAPWPACLEDAKAAVRWMRANAHEIGLDPSRLAVAGGSAGGVLSALVAATPGRFEGDGGNGDQPSHVKAAAIWYPIADLRPSALPPPIQEVVARLFGEQGYDEQVATPASPITYAQTMPPLLTMMGDSDPVTTVEGMKRFHDQLTAHGTHNELVVFPGLGHSFDFSLERWYDCYRHLRVFLRHHLESAGSAAR